MHAIHHLVLAAGPKLEEELVGRRGEGWGLLYCETFFRKSWIYAITLETSLAASAETENACATLPSVPLL